PGDHVGGEPRPVLVLGVDPGVGEGQLETVGDQQLGAQFQALDLRLGDVVDLGGGGAQGADVLVALDILVPHLVDGGVGAHRHVGDGPVRLDAQFQVVDGFRIVVEDEARRRVLRVAGGIGAARLEAAAVRQVHQGIVVHLVVEADSPTGGRVIHAGTVVEHRAGHQVAVEHQLHLIDGNLAAGAGGFGPAVAGGQFQAVHQPVGQVEGGLGEITFLLVFLIGREAAHDGGGK